MRHSSSAGLTLVSIPIVAVALSFLSYTLAGQSRNPIQAARDAINAARQPQQNPSGQNQRGAQPNNPASATTAPASAGGDCCSPNALKELAGVNGKLDILGIKLGMTLEEATAAIKAANPKLKIEVLDAVMNVAGKEVKFQKWVLAHTFGGVANPVFFHSPDGSQESIALELSMPPNTQVVTMISRHVGFANTAPVAASTLLDALRKKYGTENTIVGTSPQALTWVYDTSGNQLAKSLPREVGRCVTFNGVEGFPVEMRGGVDLTGGRNWGRYDPATIQAFIDGSGMRQPVCAQYTVVVVPDLGNLPPNTPRNELWVGIFSDTLQSRSVAITGAYLKQAIESQTKQQEDAAKQRSAPKL